jgi:hypothetical protein
MRIAVSRAPGAERDVTPLELFFDLVYVFAIGRLSHHLFEHVDQQDGDREPRPAFPLVALSTQTRRPAARRPEGAARQRDERCVGTRTPRAAASRTQAFRTWRVTWLRRGRVIVSRRA